MLADEIRSVFVTPDFSDTFIAEPSLDLFQLPNFQGMAASIMSFARPQHAYHVTAILSLRFVARDPNPVVSTCDTGRCTDLIETYFCDLVEGKLEPDT